jgi:hypothetical protein
MTLVMAAGADVRSASITDECPLGSPLIPERPVRYRPDAAIAEPAANVSDGSIVLKKSNFPVDHNLNARRQALGEFR